MQKAPLLDLGHDLATEAVHGRSFMGDDQAAGLLHRGLHGVNVPRDDRLKVDDFARDAFGCRSLGSGLQASHLRAPTDQRDVGALAHNIRLSQRKLVVADGHVAVRVLEDMPIQDLRLEEHYRIWVTDRGQQEPLGLLRSSRHHDLQARAMGEVRLHALAVVHAAVAHCGARCADRDVATTTAHIAVPVLGNLVHDLVEGWEDVVSELHLGDGLVACHRQAHGKTGDGLLTQRRIHHSLRAELIAQAHGAPEDSAKANVLPEDHSLGIRRHRNVQGTVNRGDHCHPLRGARRRRRHLPGRRLDQSRIHRRHGAIKVTVATQIVVRWVLPHVLLCLLPLLLQVPRHLSVYIREHLPECRSLLRLPGLECCDDVCLGLGLQFSLLLGVPSTHRLQVCPEARNGAPRFPLLHLVRTPVGLGVVGRRVVADTISHQLQQHRRLLLDGKTPRLLRRQVHGHQVVAIHSDRRHAEGRAPGCNAVADELVFHVRGDRESIVSADEQGLRAEDCRKVQRRQRITFRGSTVAKVGHGHAVLPVQLEGVAGPGGLWDLCAQARAHALHIFLQEAVVHLQVAAFAPVALVANVLVTHLLWSQASPQKHAQLAVLRPYLVLVTQGSGRADACSLLAKVCQVETDAALALHGREKRVVDGGTNHQFVHLQALLHGERQGHTLCELAALAHDPEDREIRAGASEFRLRAPMG
mmetsp:Transcript_9571/g.33928  ORF Transcript_9571/g.33928 Transcript_9571/m.33928 type:complete len:698 (+) Transcript_9571:268-2361(+)